MARKDITLAVALFVLLSLCQPTASALATTGTGDRTSVGPAAQSEHRADRDDPDNETANSTTTAPRHQHPNRSNERGNLSDEERYLAGRLAEFLGEGTVELSEGEYEASDRIVGDRYDEVLGQYVEVTGRTSGRSDDRSADEFEAAQRNFEEFSEGVQEYHETLEEYREAKRTGNETRARELAREIDRLVTQINRSGSRLEANYERLSEKPGVDLTEEASIVERIRTEVKREREELLEAEFVETRLVLTSVSDTASFRDPLVVEARLTTANGTALADRTVRIDVGSRTVTVETDESGAFTLTYRPTTLPVGEQSVNLTYVPDAESVYQQTNATLTTHISAVTPSVTVETTPDSVGFDERVVVDGRVAVDDVGVPGVPVVVTVGGTRLGTTTTDANGTFELETLLPAGVDPGEVAARATVDQDDRAIARAGGESDLVVTTTGSTVTVEAERLAGTDREVAVSGRLATVDGTPIADRSIDVRIDGETVAVVRTNDQGRFRTTLSVPRSVLSALDDRTVVTIAAVFDGSGTNLEGSSAKAQVTVLSGSPWEHVSVNVSWAALLAVAAVLGAVLLVRFRYGGEELPGDTDTTTGGTSMTGPGTAPGEEPTASTPDPAGGRSLLAAAREYLSTDNHDDAVEVAYAAVRRHFVDRVPSGGTHRQFYRRFLSTDGDPPTGPLRRLTDLYERAAFDRRSTSHDDAEEAVDAASSLVDDD